MSCVALAISENNSTWGAEINALLICTDGQRTVFM